MTLPDEDTATKLLGIAINVREPKFKDFLDKNGIVLPHSRERAVLLSMWYQSPGGGGESGYFRNRKGTITNMVRALQEGNRAEAWYEIRYGSNGDQAPGIAKRRFAESEIFGLYEDANDVEAEEAKQVYRMLQAHRVKMLQYEGRYAAQIAKANTEYDLSGPEGVDTLVVALDPAKSALVAVLNEQHPSLNLDADSYLSTNIYVDPGVDAGQSFTEFDPNHTAHLNAREYDAEGQEKAVNNILIGEGGEDILDGGQGDDILLGGAGFDTYLYRPGDSNDTIVDADGQGIVFHDAGGSEGLKTAAVVGLRNADGNGTYTSPDGRFTFTWSGVSGEVLVITLSGGGQIRVEDFHPGDFHIQLLDLPTEPPFHLPVIELDEQEEPVAGAPFRGRPDGTADAESL
ncbi:MAG: hypothetical protein ACREYE_22055 [Gammaproteobacteria bacterium]